MRIMSGIQRSKAAWFFGGVSLACTLFALIGFNGLVSSPGRVDRPVFNDAIHRSELGALVRKIGGIENDAEEVNEIRKTGAISKGSQCARPPVNNIKPDFDVGQMHHSLKLEQLNWDGDVGVWDVELEAKFHEEFEQRNRSSVENGNPLKVFVVPFSHSDPGWLMTIDQYFLTYTQSTLNLVVEYLQKLPDMTFVWAETSFFQLWWDSLKNATYQEVVKELIKSGRLEIVNGGYVMPDEATCSYYAIIHQYIYGHQWLLKNVGAKPKHGFSIDPFGYSSTMPYILKNLGMDSMFIQRIHYVVRKQLMNAKANQFSWMQPWDHDGSDSMFCFMSNAVLYDIKHTCGVEPNVCMQYDYQYKDLQWNNETTRQAAESLLLQFQKSATFFPHNTILFPIGMDFRWHLDLEWEAKHFHFRELLDHINENYGKEVHVQFGTYMDYYDEVFKRMGKLPAWNNLPKVVGDFFPYADRQQEYWTGYFTSHPFQKALSRDLENHLRVADMLYSVAIIKQMKLDGGLLVALESATKALGLFQHHDAVTGTSKQAVMDDYEQRLYHGLHDTYAVIQHLITTILWPKDIKKDTLIVYDKRKGKTSELSSKDILSTTHQKEIVVFNSIASHRTSVAELLTDSADVSLTDALGKTVKFQTSLCYSQTNTSNEVIPNCFRLVYFIQYSSIGIQRFILRRTPSTIAAAQKTKPVIKSSGDKEWSLKSPIVISNKYFEAHFSPTTGVLQSITSKDGVKRIVQMEWKAYEAERSGAYLFIPKGIEDFYPYPREMVLIEGTLFSELRVTLGGSDALRYVYRIYKSDSELDASIHLEVTHNVSAFSNAELVLRLSTDIQNDMTFFTDSNGFQMVKRKASHSLPMQANYYPATSMAFIQDDRSRLTVHLSQANGVGSQDLGQLEVMLDRTLMQDDARGVEEALKDTRTSRTSLRIQLESGGYCVDCVDSDPTRLANSVNVDLNHPLVSLVGEYKENGTKAKEGVEKLLPQLPCDTHLLILKPVRYEMGSPLGMILHRMGTDCLNTDQTMEMRKVCGEKESFGVKDYFGLDKLSWYERTTLNFVDETARFSSDEVVKLERKKLTALRFSV